MYRWIIIKENSKKGILNKKIMNIGKMSIKTKIKQKLKEYPPNTQAAAL